jgi:hypothetical protein
MLPNSNGSNENRAKFRRDSMNPMTPCTADGGVARARAHNDLPPPLRGDAPIFTDPHARLRYGADNLSVKPGEKSRAHYAAEDRRRLRPGSGDTYK